MVCIWHQALFALQRGDGERSIEIYLNSVCPAASRALPMFTAIDAASFITRAATAGYPPGNREGQEVAAFARKHFPEPGVPFVNVHLAMAYAATGDSDALSSLERGIATLLDDGKQSSGPVVALVCEAISAYGRGQYDTALGRMVEAMPELERLGGSHAQRDVFVDLAISAAIHAGAQIEAERIARERWTRRASHLNADWLARIVAEAPHLGA